jgi:hypothetical protein
VTDRLRAWLDEQDGPLGYNVRGTVSGRKALRALRAVVGLHRGRESTYVGCSTTSQEERIVMCAECDEEWPCATIKAIEREVFGAE